MSVEMLLASAVLITVCGLALLLVAHLRLRHRQLRSTLRRVAAERNEARWSASQARTA